MAKGARLVIANDAGRRIGIPVGRMDAANIPAYAQRAAERFSSRWGTPVTVNYVPGDETTQDDQPGQVTLNLGNLPTTQEG
jgi:hypothetical protein